MKANTSLAALVGGFALTAYLYFDQAKHAAKVRNFVWVLGLLPLTLGLATMYEYLAGAELGIDELIAKDFISAESALHPGRMSPIAALGFLFLGLSVSLINAKKSWVACLHQVASLGLAVLSTMSLVGYLLGVSALYQVGPFIRISYFTAFAFLCVALASLFIRSDVGMMKLITSQSPGGMAIRRMLPAAILLPPCIGFLRLMGQRLGYYDTAQGTSLSVFAYMTLFSVLIYWTGRQMNIFARDKFEAEERFLQEETARANELQAAMRTRDEFLSIASHELKTPLTSLKLQLQMQKRAFARDPGRIPGNEKIVHFLESSDRQIQRISRLIEDMLDVGRIHSGKFTLAPEEFDFVELVREVCEQMAGEFAAGGCTINLQLPPSLPGRWDRIRMAQVLANLLSNAVKYGQGKPVEVRLEAHDDRVRLTVTDQGAGVDPINHRRIFERFERAVPGTHISGLGLGLFIVKQIVDLHGGWIRVDSALGRGATFTVDFPQRIP